MIKMQYIELIIIYFYVTYNLNNGKKHIKYLLEMLLVLKKYF